MVLGARAATTKLTTDQITGGRLGRKELICRCTPRYAVNNEFCQKPEMSGVGETQTQNSIKKIVSFQRQDKRGRVIPATQMRGGSGSVRTAGITDRTDYRICTGARFDAI